MKKIRFITAFAGVVGVSSLLAGSILAADVSAQVSSGISAATTSEMQGRSVNGTVGAVVNVLLWVVGILSVTMIVWSGFRYITSAGDTGKTTSARNTLIYAVVGLIIAMLAYAIVNFVQTQVVSTGGKTISGFPSGGTSSGAISGGAGAKSSSGAAGISPGVGVGAGRSSSGHLRSGISK